MKTLILKEVRLILPFVVTALVLAVVPVLLLVSESTPYQYGTTDDWILVLFALGLAILSVAPFGLEFGHGTFQQLMSQPLSRERIWTTKAALLAISFALVLGGFVVSVEQMTLKHQAASSQFESVVSIAGMIAMVCFTGGLAASVIFRSVITAVWFVPMIPWFLLMVITGFVDTPQGNRIALMTVIGAMSVYSLAAFLMSGYLFLRSQDVPWMGGAEAVSLGNLFRRKRGQSSTKRDGSPWKSLLWKEVHLLQPGLVIAAMATVLHLLVIAGHKLLGQPAPSRIENVLEMAYLLTWFLWLSVPMVIGATSVAEERRLGTLDAQFSLPIKSRTQALWKAAVVLIAGFTLAAGISSVIEGLGMAIGIRSGLFESKSGGNQFLDGLKAASLILLISFYASSVSRNTAQALGITALIAVSLMLLRVTHLAPPSFLWQGDLFAIITWPVIIATIGLLTCRNILQSGIDSSGSSLRGNFGIIALAVVLSGTVTTLVYNRVWEFAMPLEPEHGPARISDQGDTKLILQYRGRFGGKWFALLPDGRIWASDDKLLREQYPDLGVEVRAHSSPSSGFLPGNNWTDIATAQSETIALKRDGTLWSLLRYGGSDGSVDHEIKQIGKEAGWRDISAGNKHLLAVKNDGTLWGWGRNLWNKQPSHFTMSASFPETVPLPRQIGRETNWVACFADSRFSLGVKADGSVWLFGMVPPSFKLFAPPSGTYPAVDEPKPWVLPGEGLKTFEGTTSRAVALYRTGSTTTFADGRLLPTRAANTETRIIPKAWRDVSYDRWGQFASVGIDGSLWTFSPGVDGDGGRIPVVWQSGIQESRHSDWRAVVRHYDVMVALAADGTLCTWAAQRSRGGRMWWGNRLLRVPRRHLHAINIFEGQP